MVALEGRIGKIEDISIMTSSKAGQIGIYPTTGNSQRKTISYPR
jgi:hypothetical protein